MVNMALGANRHLAASAFPFLRLEHFDNFGRRMLAFSAYLECVTVSTICAPLLRVAALPIPCNLDSALLIINVPSARYDAPCIWIILNPIRSISWIPRMPIASDL